MRHLQLPNIALVVPRLQKNETGALVTSWVTGHKAVSHYDINFLFPLFLYSEGGEPRPNLSTGLLDSLSNRYGRALDPEAIFSYIYALLQAPLYQSRYAVLLAHGFPRIFFPRSLQAFDEVAALGRQLIRLHLFLDGSPTRSALPLAGDSSLPIGECSYTAEKTIVLNPRGLWLEGVPPEVWTFRLGGYSVVSCWLRARRGRALERRDLAQIGALVHALGLTLRTREALDPLFRFAAENTLGFPVDPRH